MPQLTISEVARQIRLRPSAIRHYERIGLLPRAERLSVQRRYDASVLTASQSFNVRGNSGFR
jgi:MerR family redox-sensitive transcriptional activator SoxR